MRVLMLSAPLQIKGPLPKLTPLLVDALGDLGCQVAYEPWGRHSDDETLWDKVAGRFADLRRVRTRLSRDKFDIMVVHTSHEWPALLRDVPLLFLTLGRRPATVVQLHGSQPERLLGQGWLLYKLMSRWLLRMCDALMLLSREEYEKWKLYHPSGRFYLVANPFVSESMAVTAKPHHVWNFPEGIPVLLFVGRLIQEKGIFDLLDAVARIKESTACQLLVAGTGPQAQEVQDRVEVLGLGDSVIMAGYLREDALAEAYRVADIFVLPTYWAEGFPTVISEAMSAGLPIVTTCLRGAADHLQEGVNALFVSPRTPERVADAVLHLLADPAARAHMSQANREKVKDFAPDVVGRQYLAVLEEVVKQK